MNFSSISIRIPIFMALCCSFSLFSGERFEVHVLDSGTLSNETKVHLYDDMKEIGYLSYTKIPLLNRYIIHSFYIYPATRNRGYGKKLLVYACDRLKDRRAHMVYIQPGPFEMIDGHLQNVQVFREEKIKKLVSLYKGCGFAPVNSITQMFAYIFYTCIGIDEDPKYLLYKNLLS